MATKRPSYERRWASSGEVTDPADKYVEGWVQEKPEHGHQNYLQQKEEDFYTSVGESGIPAEGTDITYVEKALAFDEGKVKVKVGDAWLESLGAKPLTEAQQEIESAHNTIREHTSDYSNPHVTTAEHLDTYTKAVSDEKFKVPADELAQHIANRSDPHNVTPEQLGTLPVAGGTFTGQVNFEDGLTVGGKVVQATEDTIYMGELGIKYDRPHFGDEELLTKGLYPVVRNRIEPLYAKPTEDILMPLSSDLTAGYGGGKVKASWDSLNFDPVKGLEVEGDITFSGEDALASDCTLSAIASGSVTIQIGNTVPIELSEGIQYIPLLNWDVSDPNITISGSGFIKELRIWSMPLSVEQCDGIKQEDIVAGQNIFTNKTTDGLGTAVIGTSTGISALQLNGDLGGAICTVLVDLNGGSDYATIGSIDNHHPNKLVMLPAGAALNCRLEGATDKTNVSVRSSTGA